MGIPLEGDEASLSCVGFSYAFDCPHRAKAWLGASSVKRSRGLLFRALLVFLVSPLQGFGKNLVKRWS